eukprot:TRINITY_DN21403_c0_g1_i1.p1 TRINITY_DN21403_c0_g1~~TRINITY_DN21403_c0_g1_i1.p1  ORF type:complete len:168 (-),score=34.17 TRINITY_DN21403_c0_g1_i1:46-549(-)
MTVITDRSQGGSSLKDGQLELMVHRRCLHDDWFGVGESLMEDAYGQGLVVRGQHYLLKGASLSDSRLLNQEKVLTSQLSFLGTSLSLEDWLAAGSSTYSALMKDLPTSVQLLTLSKWKTTESSSDSNIFLTSKKVGEQVIVDLQQYVHCSLTWSLLEETTLADKYKL